jgi:AcrR family transcriptional regulator
MPSTGSRTETTRRRRAEILAAALESFDEMGIVATTIEDIRTGAGVSVGSLYHHFANKEAIAAALYVDLIDEYQRTTNDAVAKARTPKTKIRATIDHHIRWSLSNPAATRFLLSHREPEVRRLSEPDVAKLNRHMEVRLQAWLDREAAAGRIRRVPADVYIAIVIGPAQSFVGRWLVGSTTTSPKAAVDALSDAAWRAVRADRRGTSARRSPRSGPKR